jgi:hypothetical protein
MIDYAQSFEEFSSSLKPMDLALYAGAGMILWVVFKEKLSPVQKLLNDLIVKAKAFLGSESKVVDSSVVVVSNEKSNDVFFQLVTSWKQTRDLAVKSGCSEAVKVADQMFPFLSPTVCGENKT